LGLADATFRLEGLQTSGQLKSAYKSTINKVNACPAAENAGHGSHSLISVKNRFLTKPAPMNRGSSF
jgi:hypothetical protein